MKKTLLLSIMAMVLLSAFVGSAFATQHIWSENFNKFEPKYGADYNYKDWYQVKNSTSEANVTFTHAVVDGILQLTSNTLLNSSAMQLMYYRQVNIETGMTIEVKFSGNNVFITSIDFMRVEGGAWSSFAFEILYQSQDDIIFKYKAINGSTVDVVVTTSASPDKWYIAKLTWFSSPNHMHFLCHQDGVKTPLTNVTITNNLYDFTDVKGVLIMAGAYTTVNFFRFYVDHIWIGSMGAILLPPQVIGAIVSLAMLSAVIGILQKFRG